MAGTETTQRTAKAVRATTAAPAALVEATRSVGEEARNAASRAGETFVAAARRTIDDSRSAAPAAFSSPYDTMKGLLDMATNFDTSAFTPSPEKFQSLFGDFQNRAKTGLERGAKMFEDMGEFAKGNMEAMMASGRAAAQGAETIGQDVVSYSRKSVESATEAMKTLAAAKSPTEFFKLQSDFAKASFESAVAEGSKLSETFLKVAGEIAQPLSTRAAIAADKVKATTAA